MQLILLVEDDAKIAANVTLRLREEGYGVVAFRRAEEALARSGSEADYRAGVLHGTSTAYYESGRKKAEANYKDGVLDGPSTSWNEQGVVQNTARFQEGRLAP